MDERAAITDDRLVVTVLLFLAASSGGTTLRKTAADSVCVVNDGQIAGGHALFAAGRFAESQATFRAALEAVEQRDSADSVTRACLMYLIGYAEIQQVRPDLATGWLQRALALNPLPAPLAARLTINLAAAYLEMRELERAEETVRRASRLAVDSIGSEHPEAPLPQATLAGVYVTRGDFTRAILENSFGSEYPSLALLFNMMGLVRRFQRRYEEATNLYVQALSIFERSRGVEHLDVAQALINIAATRYAQRNYSVVELLPRCAINTRFSRRSSGRRSPCNFSNLQLET